MTNPTTRQKATSLSRADMSATNFMIRLLARSHLRGALPVTAEVGPGDLESECWYVETW
jgi:hypothetical protein